MKTLYHSILKPLLFLMNPEKAHYFSMDMLKKIEKFSLLESMIIPKTSHLNKEVTVDGLTYKNPVGLAAGFDKDGKYYRQMSKLGFGFIEIGTITPRPQMGNPKPRLFRLANEESLINRMGFNNEGIDTLVARLEADANKRNFILGGNIGKNKDTPNESAVNDYIICYKKLYHLVDYFTVNVSSPNTPGLRELQGKDALMRILSELQAINHKNKPLYLKIAPDLNTEQLLNILHIIEETQTNGIISNNTSTNRNSLTTNKEIIKRIGSGGLSGKKIQKSSDKVLEILSQNKGRHTTLIASGGVHDVNAAVKKMEIGASLVQVYTGLIYQGPEFVKNILQTLP